jgi:hypothetical protein
MTTTDATAADNLELVTKNAGAILAFEFGVHPDLLEVRHRNPPTSPARQSLSTAASSPVPLASSVAVATRTARFMYSSNQPGW